MEGLQDPYKPISRILGSWVAAKAKGDVELAEGREKNGEGKLEKWGMRGKRVLPSQLHSKSPYSPHVYLGLRVVHKVAPRTLQQLSAHMSPQPRAKPQVSPQVPSVWSCRWQSWTSRCPLGLSASEPLTRFCGTMLSRKPVSGKAQCCQAVSQGKCVSSRA